MSSHTHQESKKRKKQRNRPSWKEKESEKNGQVGMGDISEKDPVDVLYEEEGGGGFFDSLIDIDIEMTAKLSWCVNREAPLGFLRPLMIALEWSGHGVPWFIWVVIAIFISHDLPLLQVLVNMFMALVLDCLVVSVIKTLVRRQRPVFNVNDMHGSLTAIDQFSFPSGHTTRVVMLAFFLSQQFTLDYTEIGIVIGWASCVAFSRILLGRHHVLDVLFGAVIGTAQYKLVEYLWLPYETVLNILEPIHEELHL